MPDTRLAILHCVTCPRLGEGAAPQGAPLCGCVVVDLATLLDLAVFGPWPGMPVAERVSAIQAASAKRRPGGSPMEFVLAVAAQVPEEVRRAVLAGLLGGDGRLEADAEALFTSLTGKHARRGP